MLIDYHMHFMSHDVEGKFKPIDYVNSAKNRGLSEIGFSDHFIVEKIGHIDYAINYEELKKYVEAIQKLKENSDFPVKLGLEMDFVPGFESRTRNILKSYPFDYIIGAVHFIKEWPVDDPLSIPDYKKSNINELYEKYFNLVKQAIESKLFDTIGHIDLIKIFGFKPKDDITNLLEDIANILKENKVCVEVNIRGLSKPCKEIYPSEKILSLCFERKVPITLGSDAHSPEEVGKDFDKAVKMVKGIGYREIARFTRRKMELVKL